MWEDLFILGVSMEALSEFLEVGDLLAHAVNVGDDNLVDLVEKQRFHLEHANTRVRSLINLGNRQPVGTPAHKVIPVNCDCPCLVFGLLHKIYFCTLYRYLWYRYHTYCNFC